jgi:hypothetical protein
VHGQVELTHDSTRKEEVLKGLIAQHDPPYRAQWDELDENFREGMKRGIVAFSIAVERVDASSSSVRTDRSRIVRVYCRRWTRRRGPGCWRMDEEGGRRRCMTPRLLEVQHTTVYRYARPVASARIA